MPAAATTSCRDRHLPRPTSRSTSRSSAPASPGCGPHTTSAVADPATAGRRHRAGGRRLRRLGTQRRLVLGAVPRLRSKIARLRGSLATPHAAQHRCDAGDASARSAGHRRRGHRLRLPPGRHLSFARTPAQLERARAEVADAHAWGDTEDDLRLLYADEARDVGRVPTSLGGTCTPHCARIHPARLVRGLAAAVERRGVTIYERTSAVEVAAEPGPDRPRHGAGRARRPRDRGLHRRHRPG